MGSYLMLEIKSFGLHFMSRVHFKGGVKFSKIFRGFAAHKLCVCVCVCGGGGGGGEYGGHYGQFLNIPVIYHCGKNQKKLMTHS